MIHQVARRVGDARADGDGVLTLGALGWENDLIGGRRKFDDGGDRYRAIGADQ